MTEWLPMISGVCWMAAYILIIRRSAADGVYGMPIAAAAANISWELIFSFIRPMAAPQLYVNMAWLALDVPILLQCLRYGRREWARHFSGPAFYAGFALVQGMAGALVWFVSTEFPFGHRYAAFGQNLMMSALFIAMYLRRGGPAGQSTAIAVWKMIGTAAVSLYCVLTGRGTPLLNSLFLFTFVLDGLYVALLRRDSHRTPIG